MNLQQFINIIWYRRKLILLIMLIVFLTTLAITKILPKQYAGITSIVVDQKSVDPLTGVALPSQILMPSYIATQVEIINSHNVAKKVVEKLHLIDYPDVQESFAKAKYAGNITDWFADQLLKNLDIKPSRESSIIEITYFSTSPELAALIANTWTEAYIQACVELRAQPAKLSADWFDAQMLSLREKVEEAQSKLSAFQQKSGIVATDERVDIENARLSDLSRQLVESQARTNELQSRKNLLNRKNIENYSSESLQEVLNSNLINSLKTDLAIKEGNLALISKRLGVNHPLFIQAQAEVHSLQKKIQSEIHMVLNNMNSGLQASIERDQILTNALAQQKAKLLELKKQHDEIAVLYHEVENAQKFYDAAMQRTVQTRMESELNQTNIAVLNKAVPPEKEAKPKLLLNLIISLFVGGIFGLGTALFGELLNRRVRSETDIIDTLGVPVFAIVNANPDIKKLRKRK